MKTLEAHRRALNELFNGDWFCCICEHCNKQIILNSSEVLVNLYKPQKSLVKDTPTALWDNHTKRFVKCPQSSETVLKTAFSSSPDQDQIAFKCCNCGHTVRMTRKQFEQCHCDYQGEMQPFP